MERIAATELALDPRLLDEEVVRRVRAGETALYEVLMRRHNRAVYRAVRAILRDEAEVEDVMQQAYLRAYSRLDQFRGEARFSTWMISIALNEARGRLRRRATEATLDDGTEGDATAPGFSETLPSDPEQQASALELASITERAVDRLPSDLRTVFMLRTIEGLDTADAAEALGVSEDVVKTRLHRARAHLRAALADAVEQSAPVAFPFPARRCNRVVAAVLAAIEATRH
ncbi:RNA polymerase sigma factor [Anaeromyxobacter oryzae]|uniref:RNA polymerase sigma factor n=1 Tax=Anaeromyxobacter oryzae TaxID=2918170 RepID=A0ABN6MWC8_9BACT|nr:RNA polymerase sigma factor [Anaeromyxobacter oryzae]BDG05277.1 RNA polymerase sigma factor [Anaeromyxobacter oryzae]